MNASWFLTPVADCGHLSNSRVSRHLPKHSYRWQVRCCATVNWLVIITALLLPYTATYGPRLWNMSPAFLRLVENFAYFSVFWRDSLAEAAVLNDLLFLGAAYKCPHSVFLIWFFVFWGGVLGRAKNQRRTLLDFVCLWLCAVFRTFCQSMSWVTWG